MADGETIFVFAMLNVCRNNALGIETDPPRRESGKPGPRPPWRGRGKRPNKNSMQDNML